MSRPCGSCTRPVKAWTYTQSFYQIAVQAIALASASAASAADRKRIEDMAATLEATGKRHDAKHPVAERVAAGYCTCAAPTAPNEHTDDCSGWIVGRRCDCK